MRSNAMFFLILRSIIDLLVFMDEQGLLPDHLMLHAVVRALAGAASGSTEEQKGTYCVDVWFVSFNDSNCMPVSFLSNFSYLYFLKLVLDASATAAPTHERTSILDSLRRKSLGNSTVDGSAAGRSYVQLDWRYPTSNSH